MICLEQSSNSAVCVPPTLSFWWTFSETGPNKKTAGVENIANNMAGPDIDGDNVSTFVDLFLGVTFWFLASFAMLLCYMVFDCCDCIRRNRDIKLGKVVEVDDAQGEYERVNHDDSETETDEEQVNIDIDTVLGVTHFTNGKDLA